MSNDSESGAVSVYVSRAIAWSRISCASVGSAADVSSVSIREPKTTSRNAGRELATSTASAVYAVSTICSLVVRTRHQDTLTCPCIFEGQADLTASETFLKRHAEKAVRTMARPVRFEWDDHNWSGIHTLRKVPKNSAQT